MSDTGHDNWNGYTVGESEGKWSRVDSGLMKYERASPQTYGPPTSQAYRDGWERIFGRRVAGEYGQCAVCASVVMTPDELAAHRATSEHQQADEVPAGSALALIEASCPTTTSSDS